MIEALKISPDSFLVESGAVWAGEWWRPRAFRWLEWQLNAFRSCAESLDLWLLEHYDVSATGPPTGLSGAAVMYLTALRAIGTHYRKWI